MHLPRRPATSLRPSFRERYRTDELDEADTVTFLGPSLSRAIAHPDADLAVLDDFEDSELLVETTDVLPEDCLPDSCRMGSLPPPLPTPHPTPSAADAWASLASGLTPIPSFVEERLSSLSVGTVAYTLSIPVAPVEATRRSGVALILAASTLLVGIVIGSAVSRSPSSTLARPTEKNQRHELATHATGLAGTMHKKVASTGLRAGAAPAPPRGAALAASAPRAPAPTRSEKPAPSSRKDGNDLAVLLGPL